MKDAPNMAAAELAGCSSSMPEQNKTTPPARKARKKNEMKVSSVKSGMAQ